MSWKIVIGGIFSFNELLYFDDKYFSIDQIIINEIHIIFNIKSSSKMTFHWKRKLIALQIQQSYNLCLFTFSCFPYPMKTLLIV
jgi:hypothetical protein